MASKRATGPRAAFLLAEVGAVAGDRFAARIKPLGVTPAEAGVLRLIGQQDGLNQRALATRVRTGPSRVVALLDSLEARGLVTRTRSAADRRSHQLGLTSDGTALLRQLRQLSEDHQRELLAPLDPAQQEQLTVLLRLLAAELALDVEIHPHT